MTFGSAVIVIYHIRKAGFVPCLAVWRGNTPDWWAERMAPCQTGAM